MSSDKATAIKIFLSGNAIGSTVDIGDFRVPHVKSISVLHKAGELPIVTLELRAIGGVEVEGFSAIEVLAKWIELAASREGLIERREKEPGPPLQSE